MSPIQFSKVLKLRGTEYLLKTSANETDKKAISLLFKNGKLINSDENEYNAELVEETLNLLIKDFHEANQEKYESLFRLSDKYKNDKNFEIANLIGLAYIRLNLIDEAISEYLRFVQLVPDADSIYFNLGYAYRQNNEHDKAVGAFKKAVALQPGYADYHNELGLAYLEVNDCENAAIEFKKTLELNVYFGEVYYNLGLTYIKNAIVRDDFDLATNLVNKTKEAFEMAVKINPIYKNEQFDKGIKHFENSEFEKAYNTLTHIKRRNQRHEISSKIQDFYLSFLKDRKEIDIIKIWAYLKDLQDIAAKYPYYADIYNELGIAFSIMSIYFNMEAIHYFETAFEHNPSFINAKKNLRLIKNENRGQQFLLDTLIRVTRNNESEKNRKLKIQFF